MIICTQLLSYKQLSIEWTLFLSEEQCLVHLIWLQKASYFEIWMSPTFIYSLNRFETMCVGFNFFPLIGDTDNLTIVYWKNSRKHNLFLCLCNSCTVLSVLTRLLHVTPMASHSPGSWLLSPWQQPRVTWCTSPVLFKWNWVFLFSPKLCSTL